mmetsp:Transcript_20446/g.59229  ORF Transcript_20446/g.59229 Transcript_20446/m.59229 type:complete len:153 (-) Transcript_20446:428-886(-)
MRKCSSSSGISTPRYNGPGVLLKRPYIRREAIMPKRTKKSRKQEKRAVSIIYHENKLKDERHQLKSTHLYLQLPVNILVSTEIVFILRILSKEQPHLPLKQFIADWIIALVIFKINKDTVVFCWYYSIGLICAKLGNGRGTSELQDITFRSQ